MVNPVAAQNTVSSDPVWDVIIVGGGLAGLSLAIELGSCQTSLQVLVLERRPAYERDRTWSYWRGPQHRFSHLERQCWRSWRVGVGVGTPVARSATQQANADLAYCTLDSDAFYREAVAHIDACSNLRLQRNMAVQSLIDSTAGQPVPRVVLTDGTQLRARWVIDARPPLRDDATEDSGLYQHFLGWEIIAVQDCFDVSTVDLMDFAQPAPEPANPAQAGQAGAPGLHFFYVLPYGARQALIETTWISGCAHRPDYEDELRRYIQTRFGLSEYSVVYREQGKLCLQPVVRPAAPLASRIRYAGRAAGTLRSSTGYAFLETLKDSQRLAQELSQALATSVKPAFAPKKLVENYLRNPLDVWMDAVLFDAMHADWRQAPAYFLALFSTVKPAVLVTFLSGKASLTQRALVALRLPKWPFVQAAWRVSLRLARKRSER